MSTLRKARDMVRKSNEKETGFALIDLVIVITAIGLLAAIVIPAYLGMKERARRHQFGQYNNQPYYQDDRQEQKCNCPCTFQGDCKR